MGWHSQVVGPFWCHVWSLNNFMIASTFCYNRNFLWHLRCFRQKSSLACFNVATKHFLAQHFNLSLQSSAENWHWRKLENRVGGKKFEEFLASWPCFLASRLTPQRVAEILESWTQHVHQRLITGPATTAEITMCHFSTTGISEIAIPSERRNWAIMN